MTGSGLMIQNAVWRGTSIIGTKALTFGFFMIAGRLADVDSFGYLVFSLTVAQIALTFMDFGVSVSLTRFAGKKPNAAATGFESALSLRGYTFIAGAFALLGMLYFWPMPGYAKYLVLILGLGSGSDSVAALYRSLYVAGRDLRTDAWATLAGRAVFVFFGGMALYQGLSLPWVGAAHLAGSLVTVWFLARQTPTFFTPNFDHEIPSNAKKARSKIWEVAWPLALVEICTVIYFRIDMVILEYFRGPQEVALYGAAYKLLEGAMAIPAAVLIASFPGLVKRVKEPKLLAQAAFGLEPFLLIVAMTGVGFGLIWAPKVLTLAFGQNFGSAAPALRILMPALVLIYLNYLFTQLMVAAKLQRQYLIIAAICAGFNILANLWAIPRFGLIGAAWTSVGAEGLLCIGARWVLRPYLGALRLKNIGIGILLGAACFAAGVVINSMMQAFWGMIGHFALCSVVSVAAAVVLRKKYGFSK